jgi:hypothetical protein
VVSQLAKFSCLEDLELENAEFTSLPKDLSSLKALTSVNILGHHFVNLEQAVIALKTLPKLKKLWITVKAQEDEEFLVKSLPDLELLNDKCLVVKEVKKDELIIEKAEKSPRRTLDEQDLRDFDEILRLMKNAVKLNDVNIEDEYRKRISVVTTVLSDSLNSNENSPVSKSAMIFKARYGLADLFATLMQQTLPMEQQRIWSKIKSVQDSVIENLLRIIMTMRPETEKELEMWKARCKEAEKEMTEAVNMYQLLQNESVDVLKNKEDNVEVLTKEKQELLEKITILENTNKKQLAVIVKYSKGTPLQSSVMGNELNLTSTKDLKMATSFTVIYFTLIEAQ